MNSPRALFLLGILVILSPYIGIPYAWLRIMLPLLGGFIVLAAFRVRSARPRPTAPSYDEQASV